MDPVGLDSGGIDHITGLHRSGGGFQPIAPGDGADTSDRSLQTELNPIAHRRLGHGQGELPGIYDTGSRSIEGPGNLIAQIGFQSPGLLSCEELQT